jgi:hypothetical protein
MNHFLSLMRTIQMRSPKKRNQRGLNTRASPKRKAQESGDYPRNPEEVNDSDLIEMMTVYASFLLQKIGGLIT